MDQPDPNHCLRTFRAFVARPVLLNRVGGLGNGKRIKAAGFVPKVLPHPFRHQASKDHYHNYSLKPLNQEPVGKMDTVL